MTKDGGEGDCSAELSVHDDSGENEEDYGYTYNPEFDRDVITAINAIKDDLARQLGLASDRQSSMVQSIGIILAFASILLIEAIRTSQFSLAGIPCIFAIVAFFLCCLIGIKTIWEWKNWEMYIGFDSDGVVESFNEWRFTEVHGLLLDGVIRSNDEVIENNYILKERITLMIGVLLAGIALMLLYMVVQWV